MISTITETTELYRGTVNNGVHTVLTETAFEALMQRRNLARQLGTYDGTEALLTIAAAGTFAFVHAKYYSEYYRGYAVGTLEDLDAWAGGSLLTSGLDNYVPFSNGTRDVDPEYIRTPREVIEAFGLVRPTV